MVFLSTSRPPSCIRSARARDHEWPVAFYTGRASGWSCRRSCKPAKSSSVFAARRFVGGSSSFLQFLLPFPLRLPPFSSPSRDVVGLSVSDRPGNAFVPRHRHLGSTSIPPRSRISLSLSLARSIRISIAHKMSPRQGWRRRRGVPARTRCSYVSARLLKILAICT